MLSLLPPSAINSSLVQQLQPLQNKFYKARKAYENNGSWKRNPDAVVASYDKFALPSGISDEKLALNDPAVRAYRANIAREQANTKYGYKSAKTWEAAKDIGNRFRRYYRNGPGSRRYLEQYGDIMKYRFNKKLEDEATKYNHMMEELKENMQVLPLPSGQSLNRRGEL